MKTLIEQLKDEKEKLKSLCPFKEGDILQWEENGVTKVGTFAYLYVNDRLEVSIKINLPVDNYIGWTGSYSYINNPDYSLFEVIENPCNADTIYRLDDMIWSKEKEIDKSVELLKRQKRRLINLRESQQKKCIHDWDKGYETGKIAKHLIGESEVKLYTCKRCGKEVESA